jgi:predicted nucleic acid-binding Zn ribbon protein
MMLTGSISKDYIVNLVMKRMREKMGKPAPLGTILQQAMKASRIDVDLDAHRLWQQWEDVVGTTIAQNARPEAIKGKLLLVNVSSAPWMQQLQFLKPELIARLNENLGKEVVEEIRFRIGPLRGDV